LGRIDILLWDEWLSTIPDSVEDVEAEMAGLLQGMNQISNNREGSLLTTSRIAVFQRIRKIWSLSTGTSKIDLANLLILPKSLRGRIFIKRTKEIQNLLNMQISRPNSKRSMAWLRGLWGPCGSLFKPKNGYYLVFRLNNSNSQLESIKNIFNNFNLNFNSRNRLGGYEFSLRNQDSILEFLSDVNLTKTSMAVQERIIFRSMRNFANKIVNCDSSNIKRSINASRQQLELASKIEELGIGDMLPHPLKEVIIARLSNPSATLRELGQSLQNPISKSTVEYRWKKIEDILMEIERGGSYNVPWKT